jgi:hypothetical protein
MKGEGGAWAVRTRTGMMPRHEGPAERRTRRPSRATPGEGDHPRWAAGAAGAGSPEPGGIGRGLAYGERNANKAHEATGECLAAERSVL